MTLMRLMAGLDRPMKGPGLSPAPELHDRIYPQRLEAARTG